MKYLLILGYGWSGSSAVFDLLNEYENVDSIPIEFRIIKDPYGLMDLRYNLISRWDPLNVDKCIKNFIWHAKYLNQKVDKFHFGLGYSSVLGPSFKEATDVFLKSIIKLNYSGYWFFFDYESGFKLIKKKVLRRLHFKKAEETMYYSDVNSQQFDECCKEYIDNIFKDYCKKDFLILDQAIPAQYPNEAKHFFKDFKVIIVDRDPRDVFCDLINDGGLIGQELRKTNNVDFFVDWFLKYRKKYQETDDTNIKRISFEELVENYDKTVEDIENFIGLNSTMHLNKKKYFDPDKSIHNIGLWKSYNKRNQIEEIASRLSQYIKE